MNIKKGFLLLLLSAGIFAVAANNNASSSERQYTNNKYIPHVEGDVGYFWNGIYSLNQNSYYWNYKYLEINVREHGQYYEEGYPPLRVIDTHNVTIKIPISSITSSEKGYIKNNILYETDNNIRICLYIKILCITQNARPNGHSYFKINIGGFCAGGDGTVSDKFIYYINYFDVS